MKTLILCSALVLAFAGCGAKTPVHPAQIAVTSVGVARGSPVQLMVPTSGATLTSADGRLKIEIPSGAVSAAQMITIQPISNMSPGGLGSAYRLGPDGTRFATPVKLTFSYSAGDIAGGGALGLKVAYQDSMGQWDSIKSLRLNEVQKTVTVETSHFSDWSMLLGWQLKPVRPLVRINDELDLSVITCNTKEAGPDLFELMYECEPDPEYFPIKEWTANGAVNGNASVGTLAPTPENAAHYTAPASVPRSNPVTVSATALEKSGRKTFLTSDIWIDGYPPVKGTLTSTQRDLGGENVVVTTTTTARFEFDKVDSAFRVVSGTVKAKWDSVKADCETHLKYESELSKSDGSILLVNGTYFPQGSTTGNFTGTSNCNVNHIAEALTVTSTLQWWPVSQDLPMIAKGDGSFEDSFTNVNIDGKTVSAEWSLLPISP